mmetsp:Transcript_4856/g.651  ORF Transcript_4856/g.651 Transcript_4856/m.651 type:complete len:116 (+) Transcript_4856:2273-2620(+)
MTGLINAARRLHDKACEGLIFTTSKYFDKIPQGRILGRFTRDIFIMDDLVTLLLAGFVNISGNIVGSFIVMLIISWYAVFPIIIEIIIVYLAIKYSKFVIRQLWKIDLESRGPIL